MEFKNKQINISRIPFVGAAVYVLILVYLRACMCEPVCAHACLYVNSKNEKKRRYGAVSCYLGGQHGDLDLA